MSNPHLYFVILAGGNGERLWPLSRQAMPKQLLKVSTETTLLEQVVDRIGPLAYGPDNIWISTTTQHAPLIASILHDRIGRIIIEPEARNTAPAILHCCHLLHTHDAQARVVFLPADAFIGEHDYAAFRAGIHNGIEWIEHHNSLVLCGVKPHYPATGYGYIEYAAVSTDSPSVYRVNRFHEKPTRSVAHCYMQLPNMLWNIGIIGGSVAVFITHYQRYAPDLFSAIAAFMAGTISYAQVPAISVDYALLERASDVYVVPLAITWCDVGNIGVLLTLQQKSALSATLLSVNAHDNLAHAPHKLVVFVGVDNLCVVDTADVLLITHVECAESVKGAVDLLKKQGSSQYL